MRENGVPDFPDPQFNGDGGHDHGGSAGPGGQHGPRRPRRRRMQACEDLRPQGGGNFSEEDRQEMQDAVPGVRRSACATTARHAGPRLQRRRGRLQDRRSRHRPGRPGLQDGRRRPAKTRSATRRRTARSGGRRLMALATVVVWPPRLRSWRRYATAGPEAEDHTTEHHHVDGRRSSAAPSRTPSGSRATSGTTTRRPSRPAGRGGAHLAPGGGDAGAPRRGGLRGRRRAGGAADRASCRSTASCSTTASTTAPTSGSSSATSRGSATTPAPSTRSSPATPRTPSRSCRRTSAWRRPGW